ncbi:MAG: hypothetical protein A2452_12145 [Candidatus Firestonebacteria bacterium RIFOXYC2_FULL_39_67]|nr:MAG: hypothetical protein A2536_00190 [Candidatus Firestonebacteria bacterium RIFOXYD2_FULL_39_29]OGF55718.1 MAG: hypothetical protein A2452_12145 [Candidatus Firestonebacteria bacterium RIFOXYC2_FULL_39_67]OGF57965.1 MAG: hypothetical protein A2497_02390 [Candidatus Firestonebacteria bacterium RifOxyC12_full_39_7]
MVIVFRIVFICVSSLVGFLIADGFNVPQYKGTIVGVFSGIAVVLLDIFSGKISVKDLSALLIGLILGLVVAALFAHGFAQIPALQQPKNAYIPLIIYIICIYFGMVMALKKKDELLGFRSFVGGKEKSAYSKILDTSVIIDGRVADIIELGFMDGDIIIPKFVVLELQMIADSPDTLKRNRGRRGLDIVTRMQKASPFIRITEEDFPELRNVDEKLLKLAKKTGGKVVTNDFNLNKVASVEKIKVLNINDLSNGLKPQVIPGEYMRVKIIKEGKENNQGIAYLEDGTMIVVDGAKNAINKEIDVMITSAIQTSAGRMIFAKKRED